MPAPRPYYARIQEAKREYVIEVLRHTHGNVAAAARIAVVKRGQFYKLLHKLGVEPHEFRPAHSGWAKRNHRGNWGDLT